MKVKALFYQDDVWETLESNNFDDITLEYGRIVTNIGNLEASLKEASDAMIDGEKPLQEVREYIKISKSELKP